MSAFLSVQGVSRRYGDEIYALRDVTFDVRKGEWIAFMGPSGSGKTTLLNVIAGLDRPTSGTVTLEDVAVTDLAGAALSRYRRERVGLVFQQFHLVPYLTAVENVMLAQYIHSIADEAEAREALSRVGLAERADHLPSELSGGEQQRVCIARAVVNRPAILLADEPTGNLDERNEEKVLALLRGLHQEGHTILMVTHDDDAARNADRRIEMHHGSASETRESRLAPDDRATETLGEIYARGEAAGTSAAPGPVRIADVRASRYVLHRLRESGFVGEAEGMLRLTDSGMAAARDLVRRQRLAERLMPDWVAHGIGDDSVTCRLDASLSPDLAERVCQMLGHPATCPHGRPIPPGPCCAAARSGPAGIRGDGSRAGRTP